MTREIKVTVTLRWEGRWLTAGVLRLGEVMEPMPMSDNTARTFGMNKASADKWIGLRGDIATGYHPTREAAMEAVEAAVIKALGGEITPSGQMDAILQDQNERDRFPRPMGGK